MKQNRIDEWREAADRCRLSAEEIEMAKAVGLSPKSLIKNIPNARQRWKAPVKQWVRELYEERFPRGHKKAGQGGEATLSAESSDAGQVPEDFTAVEELAISEQKDEFVDEINPFNEDDAQSEGNFRGSEREIEEQNRMTEKKRASLRRAGELVAEEFGKLDFVHKVVLFGSVAKPPFKEVSRFRPFRSAGIKIWHESKDVDLAVWVSDLTQLRALNLARGRAVNRHQIEAAEKCWPGVPHHQVDVFLLEQRTNRYRGNLCIYGTCPKGKPECNEAGCGAQPFLRIYEGFRFDRMAPFGEYVKVLFFRSYPDKVFSGEDDPHDRANPPVS
jgi:predicted nucleotidyltransferase